MPTGLRNPRCPLAVLGGLALLLLLGCQDTDEIQSYKVPHEEKPEFRLLGVIAPRGEKTWFVKLAGPAKAVDEHRDEFDQFVASLHFTKDAGKPVEWKVPEGWRDGPKREERHATFLLGPADAPLEVIVTALGKEAASVRDNVNRWRGQIGLLPIPQAQLDEVASEVPLDGGKATLVAMTGRKLAAAPMGPVGHPAIGKKPETPAGRPGLKYTTPEGWKEQTPDPNSPIPSVATFRIADGDKTATVTVIPLTGDGGGMAGNVQRWRDQVKLGRASEEQVRRDVQEINLPAGAGYYADLTGPESEGRDRKRLLAVAVEQAGQSWFFKMLGPADLVGKQKANFEAFVRSVRFDDGKGANP